MRQLIPLKDGFITSGEKKNLIYAGMLKTDFKKISFYSKQVYNIDLDFYYRWGEGNNLASLMT